MSQRRRRSLALLTSGVLALPLLAGCGAGEDEGGPAAAGQDIAAATRDKVADGGVLRWAVDSMPGTLNAFQADADTTTNRIAGAVLPQLFVLDGKGRPVANPDYLEKAEVVEREPKQVVLYKLNQQAVWSDGREIGAADFVAQWRALNGKDSAYWTARNAGYDRIEKIERGKTDLEVKVTFVRPYADWRSLFSPLYPKQVTGTPESFNEGARGALKVTAGPFGLGAIDKKTGTASLTRNPRWWGSPAKLDTLVLTAVPRSERPAALAAGKLDLAEIDRTGADRIALARRDAAKADGAHGPAASVTAAQATLSWALAFGLDEDKAKEAQATRQKHAEAVKRYAEEQSALRGFTVRKSLEPAYTQLAMNGASGPLADERVRRAVARALDRQALADIVLKPLGLPAKPVGSHLALAGQQAYADNSDALGGQDTQASQALLADAGWRRGGKITEPAGAKAGAEAAKGTDDSKTPAGPAAGPAAGPGTGNDGLYIVGQEDSKPGGAARAAAALRGAHPDDRPEGPEDSAGADLPEGRYRSAHDGEIVDADAFAESGQGGPGGQNRPSPVLAPEPFADLQEQHLRAQAAAQADAVDDGKRSPALDAEAAAEPADPAKASTAPAPAKQAVRTSGNMLAKDGKPLALRFVLPAGPGSEALRTVGERIAQMLQKVGVQTELTKVADESFFKDHIASGQYDLALYSWPATAYPATDARPIFAKPEPAADGSLLVEQNYTRVGTDHIDQLFDQALGELDEAASRELMRKADARIWATAGSIPLYQRPELVAVKPGLANAGAFGLGVPRYQDIGWKKPAAAKEKNEKK
ncbi:ABC transporter family substrate-binding protein [Streptomyces sp. ZAF1911]|uniref:ABC transporter family substrate-binding protein n=1 Tax=Streptomyces sp. ZAF1911 TaxID=2944129 RepID=UPI00237B09A2|nr:ABC transporter family substrate-binding protein [Streptomyces sp. ZAF1911]MDD9378671.1 ABC transporter family substrate-binding protein [Streptomyces sp. ZAF1911]